MAVSDRRAVYFARFNDEVKHIKVVEKDSWIHITEAKKFESLLVRGSAAPASLAPGWGVGGWPSCRHSKEERPPAPRALGQLGPLSQDCPPSPPKGQVG